MGCMQSAEESSAAAPRGVAVDGVKVLLFDLDDTLYQNGGATEKRLRESIEAYVTEELGLKPEDARALYKEYGTVLHGLLQTGKIQENDVEYYLATVHDISLKEVLYRPEVRDLLQSLSGTTNWVFTASIRKHAERCLKKLKLEEVFQDRIIDAHDVEYKSKHEVVAFKKALAIAKASPKEAMLFDDSVNNIQTAKSLGMKTCLVGRYARDTGKEVVCEEADFIIDDLLDIKTVIPGLFTTKQQKFSSKRSSALVAAKSDFLDMDIDGQSVASSVLEVQQAQAKTKTNRVVVVLGGPGSGKGTQCQRIVDTFEGVTHLSAGDLLRQELADPSSANATLIAKYIKEGKIVPSEVTMNLIVQAMESSENSVFFIDGCPRDAQNLKSFYDVIIDSGKAICVGVLVYDCSEEAMLERILERGKTSGRTDDNIESTMKRFKTFRNETMPVVGALRNRYRVTTIDAARDIDAVFETTKSTVQKLLDGSKDY